MQKLSACRKRGSSIQRFSSTSMRCIIAICPAGPPKLMQPIFSQTRNASPKLGEASALASIVSVCTVIASRRLRGPIVPLLGRMPQPCEERIIDDKAALDHAVIVVARQRGEAKRNSMQARGFRREIVACRVGAAHEQREPREMRIAF